MEQVEKTYLINLDSRPDRLKDVTKQLAKVPLENIERFSAIAKSPGWLGCTESHIACLRLAQERKHGSVFICEDDLVFTNAPLLQRQLSKFFKTGEPWDVIIIGGNVYDPYEKFLDCAVRVRNCQTTTAYIVAGHYISTLLENFEKGHSLLMENLANIHYRLDMYWKRLMKSDRWYAIVPLTVIQKPDYSDTENKFMDTRVSLTKLGGRCPS